MTPHCIVWEVPTRVALEESCGWGDGKGIVNGALSDIGLAEDVEELFSISVVWIVPSTGETW